MDTLQKTLSKIRELQDEELDLVGGLVGTSYTNEVWTWTDKTTPDGHGYTVPDSVRTTTGTD